MKLSFTKIFYLIFFLSLVSLFAQTSLTVSDPQSPWYQYKGTIEEATFSVGPKGLYSQVSTYITFSARGTSFPTTSMLEVVLRFNLPEGSFVTDLWLWVGEKISKGVILDTWTASSIYEGIVNRRRDPAILTKKTSTNYELRVFPMEINGTRKVRVTYLVPNTWLTSNLAIPLPFDILKTSLNKVPNVSVVTWKNGEWQNPRLANTSAQFQTLNDSFFGEHLKLYVPNYDTYNSPTLEFDNPMLNGVYLKFYKTNNEGYYQLSLFPGTSFSSINKKVLFLVDYDSRKSSVTRKQIVDGMKSLIQNYFKPDDQFNIMYSGLNIGKLSNDWISATPADINNSFNNINENSISVYSNLPTLLREGYDYLSKKGSNGFVYLISCSDQLGSNVPANQLIADIKSVLKVHAPTYILDINDKEYTYYYFNNRSYLGNEYFYDNLARTTGGTFSRMSGGFTNSLSDVYLKMGDTVNSFDLYTTLENGFCFSRQNVGSTLQTVQLNKAITQVGKFIGDFPFIIRSSGVYNSTPFSQSMVISDLQSRLTDDITEKMWVSSYINSLESGQISNTVISEILSWSIKHRILSKYSAFLALEDDTSWCYNCYRDDGALSDVEESEEIPTEFSVEAYPNPFNSQVTITVKVPLNVKSQSLSFKIYNVLGQVVRTFKSDEVGNSNILKFHWDGKNDFGESVTSGVYVFMVSGKEFNRSLKLMFLK